jgi:hypothetical protein
MVMTDQSAGCRNSSSAPTLPSYARCARGPKTTGARRPRESMASRPSRRRNVVPWRNAPAVMWSADELVVIYSERVVLEPSQALMAEQWRGMGVELQPSQTRVTHTWHVEAGGTRVNVLGFNIRQYPMKATRGYQSITTPSRQAVAQHQR